MDFITAKSAEQKKFRVKQIVDATAKLFETMDYEEITFSMIAVEAGFTRSNLYKYFKNKEDIFFEILNEDITKWQDDIIGGIAGLSEERTVKEEEKQEQFAELWADITLRHIRMVKLHSIQHSFLDKYASFDNVVENKRILTGSHTAVAEAVNRLFPDLEPKECQKLLLMQFSLICGLYSITHLSDKQRLSLDAIGIDYSEFNFKTGMKFAIRQFLKI